MSTKQELRAKSGRTGTTDADFYGVSVDYLLCRTENREQTNTPLTELHLSDEMVALLKSGRRR